MTPSDSGPLTYLLRTGPGRDPFGCPTFPLPHWSQREPLVSLRTPASSFRRTVLRLKPVHRATHARHKRKRPLPPTYIDTHARPSFHPNPKHRFLAPVLLDQVPSRLFPTAPASAVPVPYGRRTSPTVRDSSSSLRRRCRPFRSGGGPEPRLSAERAFGAPLRPST